jgi:hypothetical protein
MAFTKTVDAKERIPPFLPSNEQNTEMQKRRGGVQYSQVAFIP